MTPDTTAYTHDELARLLGIQPKTVKSARQATAAVSVSPAAALAATAPECMPLLSQLKHDLLHCVVASIEADIDSVAPTPATMLGGVTPHCPIWSMHCLMTIILPELGSSTICKLLHHLGWAR